MVIKSITLAVTTLLLLVSVHANAALLLGASFSTNLPFGPFLPDEAIEVRVTLTNLSPDQTITICEGVCIGDELTYSLGGLASIPSGYSFFWGNIPAGSVFDGQIAGALLPGEEKVFVFGIYTPDVTVTPGLYGFSTQLQIFDATADRLMLTSYTFSGNWEVQAIIPVIIDIKPSKIL